MTAPQEVWDKHCAVGIIATEGGSCIAQIDYFLRMLRHHTNIKLVLEIGFNAGLSASAFLSARDDVHVTVMYQI